MSADGDSSELNYYEDEHGLRLCPELPTRRDKEDEDNDVDDDGYDNDVDDDGYDDVDDNGYDNDVDDNGYDDVNLSYDEKMSRLLAAAVETPRLPINGSDETGQAAPIKQRCRSNLTAHHHNAIHRATNSKGPIKQRRPWRGKNHTDTQKNVLHRLFFQGMCNHKKETEELRRQAVAETNLSPKQIDVCLFLYSGFHGHSGINVLHKERN